MYVTYPGINRPIEKEQCRHGDQGVGVLSPVSVCVGEWASVGECR